MRAFSVCTMCREPVTFPPTAPTNSTCTQDLPHPVADELSHDRVFGFEERLGSAGRRHHTVMNEGEAIADRKRRLEVVRHDDRGDVQVFCKPRSKRFTRVTLIGSSPSAGSS